MRLSVLAIDPFSFADEAKVFSPATILEVRIEQKGEKFEDKAFEDSEGTLCQQELMNLLIMGMTNKEKICHTRKDLKDVTKWAGLTFNKSNEISEIDWTSFGLIGKVQFQFIPKTVNVVSLGNNIFMKEAYFRELPPNLLALDINNNEFTGELNFREFPVNSEHIVISHNLFYGKIHLEFVPERMYVLHLDHNKFSGTANLTHLPTSLQELNLGHNLFSGTVNLKNLPNNIHILHIGMNGFTGFTDFEHVPGTLMSLDVSHTGLSGEISAKSNFKCKTTNSWVKLCQKNTLK